jgi:uncharacterized membrane protein
MGKNRLEAFSDGVIAIIITIMVLELKVPHGADWDTLAPLGPVFLSYVLSFIYVGIYWNNHHHLLHSITKVNGSVLWANLHLLFWLSLIPFVTGWMGENHFGKVPVAIYGVVLMMCALAYLLLEHILIRLHGKQSALAQAVGNDKKAWLSMALYLGGVALAMLHPWLGASLYALVALMWFIPDRRIESHINQK